LFVTTGTGGTVRAVAGGIEARAGIKEASIEAKIIRADGTEEDLGIVAHTDPEKVEYHGEQTEEEKD